MTRVSKARVSKARVSKTPVSKTPVSKTLVSKTRKAADALPAAADALPAAADALPALPQDDTNNKGPAVPTCKSDSAPAAGESAAGTANSDEPDAPSAPKWCGQIFVRRIVRSEDDPVNMTMEGVTYRIGATKAHDTSSDDTVQSVIETVPGAEYLLYAGKALNRGEATLSECGVGKNCTVEAVGRLGGGAGVYETACLSLANMAKPGAPNSDWDIKQVLSAIDSQKDVALACMVLSNHAGASTETQNRIADAGGVQSLTAAMATHKDDYAVQLWACMALQSIAYQNASTKTQIVKMSGLEAVTRAMDTFTEDLAMHQTVFGLLMSLAAVKSISRDRIMVTGVVDRAKSMMARADAPEEFRHTARALLLRLAPSTSSTAPTTTEKTRLLNPECLPKTMRASVTAGNQMPMYEQIGHTQPRSERGEWRDKLTAPVELKPLQRDPELDGKILRGELGETVRNCVLHEDKRIVSFLLSSTFTDPSASATFSFPMWCHTCKSMRAKSASSSAWSRCAGASVQRPAARTRRRRSAWPSSSGASARARVFRTCSWGARNTDSARFRPRFHKMSMRACATRCLTSTKRFSTSVFSWTRM